MYSELPVACDNGLYDHTHHGQHNTTTQQLPPPIYSTLAEGGAPADYSVITERERLAGYSMIGDITPVRDKTSKEEIPGDYSFIVETTAQNGVLDDSQQQPAPDTSNEGLVYSAVVQW